MPINTTSTTATITVLALVLVILTLVLVVLALVLLILPIVVLLVVELPLLFRPPVMQLKDQGPTRDHPHSARKEIPTHDML